MKLMESMDKDKLLKLLFFFSCINTVLILVSFMFISINLNSQKIDNLHIIANQQTLKDNQQIINDNLIVITDNTEVLNDNIIKVNSNVEAQITELCSE